MKKNIIITIILMLVVGFVAGYALKGSMKNADQGAAVINSTGTSLAAVNSAFESAAATLKKYDFTLMYKIDPSKVTASVDLNKVTKDTKPFTMKMSPVTDGPVTIQPAYTLINCTLAAGFNNTYNCCSTGGSSQVTIYNPTTGYTSRGPGKCVNGEPMME